jgi:isopenicillin N synthase-like dioxygenase
MHRAREHADINLITLLIGANEPGLEVKDKSNNWIPVSSSFEDIVCNIGDMMQLITEKRLKSTPHRVVKYESDEIKSRYSIPFFLHPSPDTILKSIYNSNEAGVLAHDFLDERLKAIKLY